MTEERLQRHLDQLELESPEEYFASVAAQRKPAEYVDNSSGAVKERVRQAIARGLEANALGLQDVSCFPEDVREVVRLICKRWGLIPPPAKKRGTFGDWIKSAREIIRLGMGVEIDLLNEIADKYEHEKARLGGVPYTVTRPGSLIGMLSAKVGEYRIECQNRAGVGREGQWLDLGDGEMHFVQKPPEV